MSAFYVGMSYIKTAHENFAKVKSVLAGIFGNTQAITLIDKTKTSSTSSGGKGGGGKGVKVRK